MTDTQNSDGGAVDVNKINLLLERARIEMIGAGFNGWPNVILLAQEYIAAEPERMLAVVERCAKVADKCADQDADAYRKMGTTIFSAKVIDASVDAAARIAATIRTQGTIHEA